MNPQTPIGWFLPHGTDRIVCPLLAINRGDTLPTRAVSLTGDLITNIDELPDDAIELVNGDTVRKLREPCQPFSAAGKRGGQNDERHLWPYVLEAMATLRPRYGVFENVLGHLTLGFDQVIADLSEIGYSVRWTVLKASDIGAPHHRARIFILAEDKYARPICGRTDRRHQTSPGRLPLAVLEGGEWVTQQQTIDGLPEIFSGPFPKHGEMVDGQIFEMDPPRPRITENDSSSLSHLPTPNARDGNGGQRSREALDEGKHQENLTDIPRLLPSPTASDADKARDNPAQANRKSPPISAVSVHFPTPRTTDANGPGRHGVGGPDLRTVVAELSWVPTLQLFDLLPPETPLAGGSRGTYRSNTRVNWGPYAAAIHRWERVLGRPSPDPTEPNKNGKPRLNARFAEFMMGLPAGWVTDVPGISRAEQLKAIGNGVVPLQAAAALDQLFSMAQLKEVRNAVG